MGVPTMPAPPLQTPRLHLTLLGPDCEAAYQRFYTDAAASAAYGGPLTPGAAWSRLAADIGSWQLQGFGVWAVHSRAADGGVGEVLGGCESSLQIQVPFVLANSIQFCNINASR